MSDVLENAKGIDVHCFSARKVGSRKRNASMTLTCVRHLLISIETLVINHTNQERSEPYEELVQQPGLIMIRSMSFHQLTHAFDVG